MGLSQVALLLNSLGEPTDRAAYVAALRTHFAANLEALSPESRVTLEANPLRVLDSKRPQDAPLIAAAPRIADFYSADAAAHFDVVQAGLSALGIPFTIDATLVRGASDAGGQGENDERDHCFHRLLLFTACVNRVVASGQAAA